MAFYDNTGDRQADIITTCGEIISFHSLVHSFIHPKSIHKERCIVFNVRNVSFANKPMHAVRSPPFTLSHTLTLSLRQPQQVTSSALSMYRDPTRAANSRDNPEDGHETDQRKMS
jgi:hypothetical protein